MFTSVLSPKAEVELSDMMLFLESERTGSGLKFLQAYEATESFIRQFPEASAIVKNDCRLVQIAGFSVLLVYKFMDNQVFVLRVIHTAKNPELRFKNI